MAENIFEKDKLSKTYLKMAMPVVLSLVITIIYNLADTFFISMTQNTELVAGVSLCGPVFTILMAFGNIYGQGGSSLLSRLIGGGKEEDGKRVSSFCFYVAVVTGVVIGLIMLVFRKPLLIALGASSETLKYASDYYTVMAIGAPAVVCSFIYTNLLRCEGKAVESMIGTVSGAVINIILDPIFISVFGMGSMGAALASVIGYGCSVLYCIYIVLKKSHSLSVKASQVKISKDYIMQIFSVGLAAAVANWMSSLAMIILNHFLLPYGSDKIAAMGIAQKVSMIVLLIITGLTFGGAPLIGYFFGGKRKDKLKELFKFMVTFIGSVSLVLSVIMIIIAPFVVSAFLKDAEIVKAGTLILRLLVVTMVFGAMVMIATIIFQASGKAGDSMILSLSRQGVIFIITVFIASKIAGYTGVIASQAVADVISAGLAAYLFYKDFYLKELK